MLALLRLRLLAIPSVPPFQVVESLPYNEKVDVYAFGLLLWEMLEDRRVFDGMGVTDFYERVVNAGARPNLDQAWPQVTRVGLKETHGWSLFLFSVGRQTAAC